MDAARLSMRKGRYIVTGLIVIGHISLKEKSQYVRLKERAAKTSRSRTIIDDSNTCETSLLLGSGCLKPEILGFIDDR